MPRRGRIALPGVPMHVIQRGNNRSACFVNAYRLMTNHVHLLITPGGADGCASLMKHQGQLHSQYFNKLYKRTGSLWEGRFRSCLVQTEDYLSRCSCYIELNPVRAHLVEKPSLYRWSSCADNITGNPAGSIKPHAEYLRLGRNTQERAATYASLIRSELDATQIDEIRAATNGGYALGDKRFRAAMAQALGRRVDPGQPGRPSRSDDRNAGQHELPLPAKKNAVCPCF